MIVWASPQRPMVLAVPFFNRQIVDTGDAALHLAILSELPVLIAIRAEPITCIIMPFIRETNRNTILTKCEHLFDQAVIKFLRPFPFLKFNDLLATVYELSPVAPRAINSIHQ